MIINYQTSFQKLIYFSLWFLNKVQSHELLNVFYNFLKIIKFLITIKKFNVFLPLNFNLNNSIFLSLWIDGFISNFKVLKWAFLKKIKIKKLSPILINLTKNQNINTEIKVKKYPFISFNYNEDSDYFYFDYFLYKNKSSKALFNNNVDITFYYIFLLDFLKKYKPV